MKKGIFYHSKKEEIKFSSVLTTTIVTRLAQFLKIHDYISSMGSPNMFFNERLKIFHDCKTLQGQGNIKKGKDFIRFKGVDQFLELFNQCSVKD